jgi:hypothetical protein
MPTDLLITEVTSNNCQFLEDLNEAQHFRDNGANPIVEYMLGGGANELEQPCDAYPLPILSRTIDKFPEAGLGCTLGWVGE